MNCHGWQTGWPPIASTVRAFRLLLADGTVRRCTRGENAELFSLALGGYGLFGIILDLELETVANEIYGLKRVPVTSEDYAQNFIENTTTDSQAALVYGRLDITPTGMFQSGILNVWSRTGATLPAESPLTTGTFAFLKRTIFRGSIDSDYGKDLRWWAEQTLDPVIANEIATRNNLQNVPVELYENRSPESTDILHEYFIPANRLATFLSRAREIIKVHDADLLNVTIRDIQPDADTFLRYADQEMFCLVMLFNQLRTAEAESNMTAVTQQLIDAALDEGGRYYLAYRLHATEEQFHRAYPQGRRFFELKRQYDPKEIFQNKFYQTYGVHSDEHSSLKRSN